MPARSARAQRLFWFASLVFFMSGGTGLAYQVIWFKRFAHVWGSSSLAFASVGGSFLFGLGLGAYWIGHRTDRLSRPLRWYGVCELLIGALALVIPFEIAWLIRLSAGFYSQLPQDPLWRYLVQFLVTLVVVGPPCVLMGGTLPLLIRQLTAREGSLDQATGWLYAINTFGAAAGCFITGFALLPKLGLLWTNNLCAALNLAIGALAVAFSRNVVEQPAAAERMARPATVEAWPPNASLWGLYGAVTLSGLAALVLEMTWSRQLALVLGGSTYAYSATLFVVLLGIALGSLLFHLFLREVASQAWLPVLVIGVLATSCLVGKAMLPRLSLMVAGMSPNRDSLGGNALVCATASMLLEFVPSLAMGILFPLFVHLTHRSAAAVGRAVGDVYAWNTLGSIVGASLTAVLLFPRIGTAGSVALATALYVLSLLLVLPMRRLADVALAAGCLVAGGAAVAGIVVPQDPLATNMGMYMYGDQKDKLPIIERLYFAEGASSNVLVTRLSGQSSNLRVNGKVDASDGLDMHTQLGLAYFPRIFKPDAKEVLVIGFGSGTTSGCSLLFPGTRVTCCEIEPAVYRASPHFAHINHRPQEKSREFLRQKKLAELAGRPLSAQQQQEIERQARFAVIFGDGRTTLQGSDKRYDIIISEPSNPWLAGVSNLFTKEFFEAAYRHLNEGGVLAQWIQTYSFTWSDYLMIVRTLRTVFPHCGMVVLAGGADTVLLASTRPLLPRRESLEALQQVVNSTPEIFGDLQKWFQTTDLRILLLRHYRVDEETLARAEEQEPWKLTNSDLNLRLEFDAPLHLFQKLPQEQNAQLKIQAIGSDAWRQRLGASVGIQPDSAEYHLVLADQELARQRYDQALLYYQNALAANPSMAEAYRGVVNIYVAQKKPDKAVAVLHDLLKLRPDDLDATRTLAQQLFAAKKENEAIAVLRGLLQRAPDDAAALDQLAAYLVNHNENREALPLLERLVALYPANPRSQAALASCYLGLKRYEPAIVHFRKALALAPIQPGQKSDNVPPAFNNVVWANNLAWVLATAEDARLRNGPEAVRWATAACEAVGYKIEFVDTLAAAYAEAGRFEEAVKFCQRFLDQAQLTRPDLVEAAKNRLKLYQSHQPYRES
jgi:spermidine synthase